jgi:predicted glutamine amidotransferase
MCGICGFYFHNPQKADIKNLVLDALIRHEPRGSDAAGVSLYLNDGRVYLRKLPLPASKFAQYLMKIPIAWDRVKIALIHTRAATCGTPLDNENNHPLYYCNGRIYSLVHNGMIYSNDRIREVDSDALLTPIRKSNRLNITTALKMVSIPGVKNLIVTDGEKIYAFADNLLCLKRTKTYTQFHQSKGLRLERGLYVLSQREFGYIRMQIPENRKIAYCYSQLYGKADADDMWIDLFASDLDGYITYFTKNIRPPKMITKNASKIKKQLIRQIKDFYDPQKDYGLEQYAWDRFLAYYRGE